MSLLSFLSALPSLSSSLNHEQCRVLWEDKGCMGVIQSKASAYSKWPPRLWMAIQNSRNNSQILLEPIQVHWSPSKDQSNALAFLQWIGALVIYAKSRMFIINKRFEFPASQLSSWILFNTVSFKRWFWNWWSPVTNSTCPFISIFRQRFRIIIMKG